MWHPARWCTRRRVRAASLCARCNLPYVERVCARRVPLHSPLSSSFPQAFNSPSSRALTPCLWPRLTRAPSAIAPLSATTCPLPPLHSPPARLVVVLGSQTYGAKGTSSQGTLEELVFAKEEGKAIFVIQLCDAYKVAEVRKGAHPRC